MIRSQNCMSWGRRGHKKTSCLKRNIDRCILTFAAALTSQDDAQLWTTALAGDNCQGYTMMK